MVASQGNGSPGIIRPAPSGSGESDSPESDSFVPPRAGSTFRVSSFRRATAPATRDGNAVAVGVAIMFPGTVSHPQTRPGRRMGIEPAPIAELTKLHDNVASVVLGKPDVIRLALVSLLADGHLLLEDVPGVGKTLLAKALARSID